MNSHTVVLWWGCGLLYALLIGASSTVLYREVVRPPAPGEIRLVRHVIVPTIYYVVTVASIVQAGV